MLDYCKVQNIPTAQSSSVGLLPSSTLQHQDLTKQLSNLPKSRAAQLSSAHVKTGMQNILAKRSSLLGLLI